MPELGLVVLEDVDAGVFHAAVDFDGASLGEVGGHTDHDVVVGLELEVLGAFLRVDNEVVVFVDVESYLFKFDFVFLRDVDAEHLDAVVGGTYGESAGHSQQVGYGDRRVEGDSDRILNCAADAQFAHVGVGCVVVDVQLVAGLEQGFAVFFKVDADVLHLGRVGEVAAEDVCHGEDALLEAVGKLDGLADRHTVVQAEGASEGGTYLSVDGDLVHVAERRQAEHAHDILGLQLEFGGVVVGCGEGQSEDFDGQVGTCALHVDVVGAGRVAWAAGIFNGLSQSHTVVEAESAAEGVADFAFDRDGPFLQIAVLSKHGDDVTGFEREVGVVVLAGIGDGEEFDSLVGAGALDDDIVLACGVFGLHLVEEFDKAAVLLDVEVAAIVYVATYGDVVLHRAVGGLDAHYVATCQFHFRLARHHVVELVFQIFNLVVDAALDLDEFGIDIVGESACVFDEFFKGFAFNHFVTHWATDGAFDADDVVGYGDEYYVVILKVKFYVVDIAEHILVEVQTVGLSAARTLDVTDGTDARGAAGGSKGVEGGVQSAEGEAALDANLAVDADANGASRSDGDGYLVGTEGVVHCQIVGYDVASLSQRHTLEEDLCSTGRVDATIGRDALVDVGLRRAEDRDMDFVTFAQHVGVGSLGAVGGAVHIHRGAGEQRMSIDVVTFGFRHVVLFESLVQGRFGSGFAKCRLGYVFGAGGHAGFAAGGLGVYRAGAFTGSLSAFIACGFGSLGLFGLHLIEYVDDTCLIASIFRRRNVVHVDSILQESSAHFGLFKTAFLQFASCH